LLKARAELAGKRVRCPACRAIVALPHSTTPIDFPIDDNEPEHGAQKVERFSSPEAAPAADDEFPDLSEFLDRGRDAAVDEDLPQLSPARRPVKSPTVAAADDAPPKPKSGPLRRFGVHATFGVLLLPLAVSIMLPERTFEERLADTFPDEPEKLDGISREMSKDDFFAAIPQGRMAGAHLAHDSLAHWVYALVALWAYWGLLVLVWREPTATPLRLLLTGLFTGTVGIVILLAFQLAAMITQAGAAGSGNSLFLMLYVIGYSYWCALDPDTNWLLSFLGFTLGVGFCEELCKAIPLVFYFKTMDRTKWRGACLVGLATGIGFGVSEGIHYSGEFYNGIATGLTYLVRFLSCVALHALWSSGVALLMFQNQDYVDLESPAEWAFFVKDYLLVAMLLHGLYDTLLKKEQELAALGVAIATYVWWLWLVRQIGKPRRKKAIA
jgi:RsiW-degrading membrane proteinase PrsW (M82 family)